MEEMDMVIDPKRYYKEKAEALYKESDAADENYAAELRRFEMKEKNGGKITESDVYRMFEEMQRLHDSVETHRQAVETEMKSEGLM